MRYKKFSQESTTLRAELENLRNTMGFNTQPATATPARRGSVRGLIEPITDSGNTPDTGFDERQIGSWDLVDANFLERGAQVSRSICKLHARDDLGSYVGTGFMVSERLLVTNEHNLPSADIAARAFVEFEYELAPDGIPRQSEHFMLKPDEAYWADADLDICIVAVATMSRENLSLSRYGYQRLDPTPGKINEGQFITLIHHPDGKWKQVALRENRLLKYDENVLWYASDTSPGSSGAPCFSDRWQVVAIHRRGVPQTKAGDENLIALTNGEYISHQQIRDLRISDREIKWVANEGVRVSVFLDTIQQDSQALANPLVKTWLEDLGEPQFNNTASKPTIVTPEAEFDENRRPKNDYEKRNGYQPDFLGINIPAPNLECAILKWGPVAYNSDTGAAELPYYNFSLWMSRERRLAFVAAVNIDGNTHNARKRSEFGGDKWEYDDRLPKRLQVGNWFYGNEPARYGRNYFDRGHIVRRTEPSWGPDDASRLANDDTFHWTNCSPQYKSFNQQSRYWQGLEDFLLEDGAVHHKKQLTIFSGPIFSEEDVEHRGVLVPREFFKVAVFVDTAGNLRSGAYVLDQSEWVDVIDFERARKLDVRTVRRSILWLEERTGLDFGQAIKDADAAAGLGNDFAAIRDLPNLFA